MYYFTCISFAIRPSGRKSAIKLIDWNWLTIATVYSTARVQLICVRFSQCWMEHHDSSSESASTTSRPHHRHHASRPPLAACVTTYPVQAVYASKQVSSSYGTVVPGRHVHSRVVYRLHRQHLRSAAHHDLTIARSRLARYGSHSFATSGPSLWNSLPLTVCDSTLTFTGFCSRLKTELYYRTHGGHTAPSW